MLKEVGEVSVIESAQHSSDVRWVTLRNGMVRNGSK